MAGFRRDGHILHTYVKGIEMGWIINCMEWERL